MNILTIALPFRFRARLLGRLKQMEIGQAADVDEAKSKLRENRADLVIFYEDGEPAQTLESLRALLPVHRGRVLFCAKHGHPAEFLNDLVKNHRVTAILHQPMDPDELVRRACIEADEKVPTLSSRVIPTSVIPTALVPVWERHQETNRERVGILSSVVNDEEPTEELLEVGRRAAHQLAGSLGTFGLTAASLLARDVETQLRDWATLAPHLVERVRNVVHALELQVADPQVRLPDVDKPAPLGSILVYTQDASWGEEFQKAASEAGYRVLMTDDPSGARRLYALEDPGEVLLDLAELSQEGLGLVHDMSGRGQSLLALLDPPGNSHLLSCKKLVKPVTFTQIFEALRQTEKISKVEKRRVLAVDDDVIVLETMSAILKALNLEVHTLQEPLTFWDTLESVQPELVFLDIDLPYVGGIELCRALRAEPRYWDLPVIFLSGYNDSETVHRVFLAGADDFVFKPVVGPELITRTRNRLMRSRGFTPLEAENKPAGPRPDLAFLIEDEALARQLEERMSGRGFKVERISETGTKLVERLTVPVQQRARVILLDVLPTNDILYSLDGLGINNYSQVWVRGDLTEEEIHWVYEWGLAGYLPMSLTIEHLTRKLERSLKLGPLQEEPALK
jgi:DNA-binding response OmpR family regulator/HPt (histidine-containing phosphotransfer) domain-containing protein